MPDAPNAPLAAPLTAQRSRTVVVSFLGAVVRPMGGWMPIRGAVDLLTPMGLDAQSVRTAVFRLKRRDWLMPETRVGVRGYALTDTALAALAAGDEVIWHAREPADLADGWCVLSFSVPESARARRHQLRSRLTALGFGMMGGGVWIAPARMAAAAERAIGELGLTSRCALFVGRHVGGEQLSGLISDCWNLKEIDQQYQDFIGSCADLATTSDADEAPEGADAFTAYLGVIDRWRKLPYRDPGLPPEVLPEDWSGPAAGALFERLVAGLEEHALAHAATSWPTAAPHPPHVRKPASP
ncbi:PaaX family transcriptional regulator [Oryzihumus sp.]